ncbi:MAG: pilus assembly protein PilC, partial [Phycisphaerae bacterium]|nr:pilus assembly protein PilC [Phycisphaerae bacterium]
MPDFRYTAVDGAGARVSGVLAGASEIAVVSELEAKRLTPIRVEPQAERKARSGVSKRALAGSYRQLSDLLRAGVPLMRSLNLLARQKSKPRLAAVYKDLADAVSDGGEVSDAMAARSDVYPKVHVAMVRAGERGGFLEQVLARLAQFVEAQAELQAKIGGSLVYPAFLVGVGVVVLSVIFGVFVPMFREGAFSRLEELPTITVVVFAISDAIAKRGPITAVILAAVGFGVWRLSRRPDVRRQITVFQTRAWIVGPLVRSLAVARFCRLLGTMEANGVPLLQAMQIARDAAGNVLLEEAIDSSIESVRSGAELAPPLAESGLFDDDVVEMIAVGEAAGTEE